MALLNSFEMTYTASVSPETNRAARARAISAGGASAERREAGLRLRGSRRAGASRSRSPSCRARRGRRSRRRAPAPRAGTSPAARFTFVLKPPARPLSPETMTRMTFFSSLVARSGCSGAPSSRGATRDATERSDRLERRRVRSRRDRPILRAAQLRRGDHLDRLRDLLRVLHAPDPPADVDEACHLGLPAPVPSP